MRDKYRQKRKEKYAKEGKVGLTQWLSEHPERAKEIARNKLARRRENLTDYYVNRLLVQHDDMPPMRCPKSLIECKRLQLKIERMIDEKRRAA